MISVKVEAIAHGRTTAAAGSRYRANGGVCIGNRVPLNVQVRREGRVPRADAPASVHDVVADVHVGRVVGKIHASTGRRRGILYVEAARTSGSGRGTVADQLGV